MNPQNNQNDPLQGQNSTPTNIQPNDSIEQQASAAAQQIINPAQPPQPQVTPAPVASPVQPVQPSVALPTSPPVTDTAIGNMPVAAAPSVNPGPTISSQAQTLPNSFTPQPSATPAAVPTPTAQPQPTQAFTGSTPPPGGSIPTIVMGGVESPQEPTGQFATKKPHKINKTLAALAGVFGVLLLAGGATAYAFLGYIPNKPTNVWNTSMERTSAELATVMTKFQEEATVQKLEKSAIEVTGDIQWDTATYKFNASSKQDAQASETSASLNTSDTAADEKLNIALNAKTQVVANAALPNIYFKISGLNSEIFTTSMPQLAQYNDKWVAVEQDFMSKLTAGAAQPESQSNLTQNDMMSITADMQAAVNEYLFTTDPAKAVITQASFVGTEKSEGITANHYKAKLDQTNARAFCASFVDKMSQNAAIKKTVGMPEAEYAAATQAIKNNCEQVEVSSEEFDLWMDKKYKVFHKARFYEELEKAKKEAEAQKASCITDMSSFNDMMGETNGASYCDSFDKQIETGERYTEFGQVFNSKNEVKLFIGGVSNTNKEKSTVRAEAIINTEKLSLEGSLKAQSEDLKYNANLTFSTKPFDGTIDSSKPTDSIPIQQMLDSLGLNSFISL